MTTEVEQALALLFRRVKGGEASEKELTKVMSLTLNWTKPSRAANLLARGVNGGHLDHEEGTYRARFDPEEIEIPFGFQPSESLFEPIDTAPEPEASAPTEPDTERSAEDEADPEPSSAVEAGSQMLETLLDRIAGELDGDRKRAVAKVNAKQEQLGGAVTLEAAALLVAARLGLDVREDAAEVLDQLRASN